MQQTLVHIANLDLKYHNQWLFKSLDWDIVKGENWVLGGKSGTGKTALAKCIAQQNQEQVAIHFDPNSSLAPKVHYVSNWYQFTNLDGDRNFYYQQRYNKQQKNDTLTVYAELEHFAKQEGLAIADVADLLALFDFHKAKDTQLIELSSGEHKKLQLIQALWLKPQLLIIDEPYTGLDKKSRRHLNSLLDSYAQDGLTLLLITNDQDLPQCIHHFGQLENAKLVEVGSTGEFAKNDARSPKQLPYFLQQKPSISSETLIDLQNIVVRYGDKEVLKNVSWTVKAGDKWLLQGPNGSGKSTLLSLLNGDHPQAYANNVTLFGQKRGSGESIWDIKEKVGIISPELHWYFDKSAKVWQTIASGFYDSIGLFRNLSHDKQLKVNQIMDFFDLSPYKDQLLGQLPLGMQRLALLARTIIKNPVLLILDEPCQGLDAQQATHFNAVVDELCAQGKTLIYVGHYETQLPHCIDHIIRLEKGEVIALEHILEKHNNVICI